MKKTKLAVFLTALLSVFTLSSCLNGSSGTVYDIYEVVTVETNYLGGVYLKGDGTSYTYNGPTNIFSSLLLSDGTYYKRAQVGIKLEEGETFQEGKSVYKISQIAVYDYVSYKDCTLSPDTLGTEKYGLVDLEAGSSRVWATNGYMNIPFTFKTATQLNSTDFELYAYKSVKDTLFLRFHQKKGSESAYSTGTGLISFFMPTNQYPFAQYYGEAVSNSANDSIIIAVTALGENSKELKKTVKYKN